MQLTLSVLTLQDQAPFTSMTHSFDQSGGSVGRHQRAGWVLLDDKKFLSGEHFSINCDGVNFFVVDTSTNGTFINDSIHPLGKNNSHKLTERDRIRLGEYVIICTVDNVSSAPQSNYPSDFPDSSPSHDSHDPFFSSGGHFDSSSKQASNKKDDKAYDPYSNSSKSSFVDSNMAGVFGEASSVEDFSDPFFSSDESFSPNETPFDKELDKNIMEADSPINIHTPIPARPSNPSSNSPVRVPAEVFNNIDETEEDVFDFLDTETSDKDKPNKEPTSTEQPKEPIAKKEKIKEKAKEKATGEKVTPKKKNKKEKKPQDNELSQGEASNTSNTSESEALKMFLKGAGITNKHLPAEVPPETFEILGHSLKEVLQGTIELLRARAETKNHLHLDRTIIGRIENNPLKFMPNAEQVIVNLLTTENTDKTYTPLDKALEEAFDDIKAHQYAMTVATQSALKGVIKQHFSPKNLADNIAKDHPISSKIPLKRQAKLWSMFESLYDDVEKEATENFQRLLDNEISNAYEKQLMELKSLRINSNNNKNSNDFPE